MHNQEAQSEEQNLGRPGDDPLHLGFQWGQTLADRIAAPMAAAG